MGNKPIVESPFSLFEGPITNVFPSRDTSIQEVARLIKGSKYAKTIMFLRNLPPEERASFKSKLAYVCWSGTFSRRRDDALIEHSGLICLDIDHVKNPQLVKELLKEKCRYFIIAFVSPGGAGVKIVFKIDPDLHSQAEWYEGYSVHLMNILNLTDKEIDPSGKDVSRAAFLSHDPDLVVNPEFYKDPNWEPPVLDIEFEIEDQVEKFDLSNDSLDFLERVGSEKLNFDNKDSELNFQILIYINTKNKGTYSSPREPWIFSLASLGNLFGMDRGIFLNYLFKYFKNHPVTTRKDNPAPIKGYFINPVKDAYKRYAKVFDTWDNKVVDGNLADFENVDVMRTANQRLADAHNQPPILMLCDVFWHTGELAILFGDTGIGKSAVAVQIADSVSRGNNPFGLSNENEPLIVVFYDFELSDKQFEKRYSLNGVPYEFSNNFRIDNLDIPALKEKNPTVSLDDLVYRKVDSDIVQYEAQVIIIDNITFLKTESTQETGAALAVMRKLIQIKRERGVSILVLAHTPKKSASDPLGLNHLAGSKQLSNFSDSVFAIGQSLNDPNTKYLKQIKPSRSSDLKYDSGHVVVFEMTKSKDFLRLSVLKFGPEKEFLASNDQARIHLVQEVIQFREEGKSFAEIADQLSISKSQAHRLYNQNRKDE